MAYAHARAGNAMYVSDGARPPRACSRLPVGVLRPGGARVARVARVAQGKNPTGTIQAGELETEDGKLIYTFEIKVPGESGIDEVNVDAMTGAVVGYLFCFDTTHDSK